MKKNVPNLLESCLIKNTTKPKFPFIPLKTLKFQILKFSEAGNMRTIDDLFKLYFSVFLFEKWNGYVYRVITVEPES